MNKKLLDLCKMEIANKCAANLDTIALEFVPRLTDEQLKLTTEPDNWNLHSDEEDVKMALLTGDFVDFDCEPFDDQLRATVTFDTNGKIRRITVQGE